MSYTSAHQSGRTRDTLITDPEAAVQKAASEVTAVSELNNK